MSLELHHAHPWRVSPSEAVAIQKELAEHVQQLPLDGPVKTVAGIDMSVRGERVQSAVVVMTLADMQVVDEATWNGPVEFPYVPGLLSFREVPAVLNALAQLATLPDLIMADAQGIAHPRRLGLASHIGVLLDIPTIGVAKSRLVGTYAEPGTEKGSRSVLRDRGETIGMVVRSRTNVKPLFISVGHRIELDEAVELALACTRRYRLPEPTRQAHLLSRRQKRGEQ